MKTTKRITLGLGLAAIAALTVFSLAAADKKDEGVVALVNGKPITRAELDNAAATELRKVRQQEYDVLNNALNRMISEQLLNDEAAARGMSPQDYLKAEIDDKLAPVTDDEVDKFYEANKSRLQGKSREESDGTIRSYLLQQRRYERSDEVLNELRTKAGVSILLEPPRVAVTIPPTEPSKGPADAPVTLVEFSDFQCPFCKRAQASVDQLLDMYGDKIHFVYRDYPLPMHPRAMPAAQAARCAGDQDKYWEYHDSLMTVPGSLDDNDLKKRATDMELDGEAFAECLDSGRHEATVRASAEDGTAVGVTGTPAFFINGRMVSGAQPFEVLQQIVDDELARAGKTD